MHHFSFNTNNQLTLTGIVVPRFTNGVMTPPAVSIPSERGATSSNSTSLVASAASPLRIPAWTAAPYAYAKRNDRMRNTFQEASLLLHQGRAATYHGLVRIDALIKLLAAKVVFQKLLYFRYPGTPSNQNNLMNLSLRHSSVFQHLCYRDRGLFEEVLV